MTRPCFSLLNIALATHLAAGACMALPGDTLTERIMLQGYPGIPDSSTAGMTVEAGEINESAGPAGAGDMSVWYEWTAPETGVAFWSMDMDSSFFRGLAAYTLASGQDAVTMPNLRPAGAVVVPAGTSNPTQARGVHLWVNAGQKFILRIWSVPAAGGSPGGAWYSLWVSQKARTERSAGDLPSTARTILGSQRGPDGAPIVCQMVSTEGSPSGFTTETAETTIGGVWYPAGCVQWFSWTAPRSEAYRFSLTKSDSRFSSVMVVREISPGSLERVSGSGGDAAFSAIQGQRYLVRLGMPAPGEGLLQPQLEGAPAEPGDEPASAAPLSPGDSALVRFAGASPTRLPPSEDNPDGNPDVWFDLGSTLTGAFKVSAGNALVTIYTADASGNPLNPVAGGKDAPDAAFLAEPGRRYLARVMRTGSSCDGNKQRVALMALPTPPANDRREGAQVLSGDGPVLITGDATGAVAEESDWVRAPEFAVHGHTVWYALDRPAAVQPWFVWAWDYEDTGIAIFREESGQLVRAELSGMPLRRFTLTGSRIWIMVSTGKNLRFKLMAGPAITPGDAPGDPVPLTTGATHYLYAGAATYENSVPGLFSGEQTLWLSWTAAQSGMTAVSTLGSPAWMKTGIYTDILAPVISTKWSGAGFDFYPNEVATFQATAGTSYRILLRNGMAGPVIVRVQPGGWTSPYDVWMQNFPAWQDTSLTDPESDTDGDGISNLMEMACMTSGGPVGADAPGFPWPFQYEPGQLPISVEWMERAYALAGPVGCIPFKLTGETSTGLSSWTGLTFPENSSVVNSRMWSANPGPGNPRSKFMRLRVHR